MLFAEKIAFLFYDYIKCFIAQYIKYIQFSFTCKLFCKWAIPMRDCPFIPFMMRFLHPCTFSYIKWCKSGMQFYGDSNNKIQPVLVQFCTCRNTVIHYQKIKTFSSVFFAYCEISMPPKPMLITGKINFLRFCFRCFRSFCSFRAYTIFFTPSNGFIVGNIFPTISYLFIIV